MISIVKAVFIGISSLILRIISQFILETIFKVLSDTTQRVIKKFGFKNGYTEGMFCDYKEQIRNSDLEYKEKSRKLKERTGISGYFALKYNWFDFKYNLYRLLTIVKYSGEFCLGWFCLSFQNVINTIDIFLLACRIVHLFNGSLESYHLKVLMVRLLEKGAAHLELGLDGTILHWSDSAYQLFHFTAEEVLYRQGVGIIIPDHEKKIIHARLLLKPNFRLNLNENLDSQKNVFKILWINFPFYEKLEPSRILCLGIIVYSPGLAWILIRIWRTFSSII